MTYVDVALAKVFTGGRFYTYSHSGSLKIGQIVKAPFGKKSAYGVVVDIVKKPTFKTKPLIQELPYILPKTSIDLLNWMVSFYPDDIGLITQLFLPTNFSTSKKSDFSLSIISKGQKLPKATPEQKLALETVLDPNIDRVLLRGETGSGKTRVFTDKVLATLKTNHSVLVLTPEIGLTPQLHEDLIKYIKSPIVLTHSELTTAKRRNIWLKTIDSKEPTVYVGPRSALFLPINSLGLIVVDEAHDKSYKQGQSPRYNSLHIAGKLASLHKASVIQSTATPNIDDYETALAHNYKVLVMKSQAAGNEPNTIKLIDLSDRSNFNKSPYLSDELIDSISKALTNKQQVMLLLNRRGSSRLIQCNSCGWQALCPNCGIPMIYHHDMHHVKCHWCNNTQKAPHNCPSCGSVELSYKIIGTKSLAEHVSTMFNSSVVKRFDADSVGKDKYHLNIGSIKKGEVDIIIGTQLISKGLDLKDLAVVGVINADTGMNLPDYRAEELTFQQLYQVSGRAGRGRILSKTFIQTRLPKHPVMLAVKNHSWQEFYSYELPKRKQYSYPPYCYLAIAAIHKKSGLKAQQICQQMVDNLKDKSRLVILGPSPSYYEKTNNKYYWQIILKAKSRDLLLQVSRELPADFSIDIDPISLL